MKQKKLLCLLLSICLVFCLSSMTALAAADNDVSSGSGTLSYNAELVFSDNGITEAVSGSGYSVDCTSLTITAAGVYHITGSCEEGSIVVKGSLSDVVLVLDDLTLKASSTAPIVIKKSSSVTVHVEGTTSLYDNEDPNAETSADPATAEAFEGAAVKAKSGAAVTFCGNGTLNIYGNAKNGIKGAAKSSLIFADADVSYNVAAANNGIAADGTIVIRDGIFDIEAVNDGIKSVPEETDTESTGTVVIYDGIFDIDVDGDGIQAETDLVIYNGYFDIHTFAGYNVSGTKYWNVTNNKDKDTAGEFDANTMSCKGIKLAGDRDMANEIYITGGTFVLNTAEDAIHSDKSVFITGGTFIIDAGDDGIHADSVLTLGTDNGYDRDPDITVNHSYEGLEAANEYIYSGRFRVYAVDDGINAAGGAGGSSSGFTPGGPGHSGSAVGDYSIVVKGGNIFVDCLGDGMDSNGTLSLLGGNVTVFSKVANGDDSPLDANGAITVNGATVFTAGSYGVDGMLASSCFGQKYYQKKQSIQADTVVNVYCGRTLMYSDRLPRAISYWLFSSPAMTGTSASITTGGSVSPCLSNDWNHNWGDLVTVAAATVSANGIGRYTCADCGAEEDVTLLYDAALSCGGHQKHEPGEEPPAEELTCTFLADEGVKQIDIYYTHDYTCPNETDVETTVARDGDTGELCSDGSGQVNFTVVLYPGYTISGVSATAGTYKNIKGPEDTGLANTYRVTKITGDMTITVTTERGEAPAEPITYSVRFDANGGTGTMAGLADCLSDKEYRIPTNLFRRTYYTFVGWNTQPDGQGISYAPDGAIFAPTSVPGDTVTLYAQWKPYSYTVAFDGNGAGSGEMESIALDYNESTALPANQYGREGYTFKNWNTKANGSGTKYADMAEVKNLSRVNGAEIVLYAQWTANSDKYSLVFDGNGATKGTMRDMTGLSIGKTYTLSANRFTKDGYHFVGWNTDPDGNGESYKDKQKVSDLDLYGGEITLYAAWEQNTYTVTFNGSGGTYIPEGSTRAVNTYTQQLVYDEEEILEKLRFARNGYSFAEWNTKKNGTGLSYADQERGVHNLTVKNNGRATLYAVWRAHEYTVVFDMNESMGITPVTGETPSLSATYDVAQALTANGFTRPGYRFTGWNTEPDGSGKTYNNKARIKNLTAEDGAELVLYAQWAVNDYSVKFNMNRGTASDNTTFVQQRGLSVEGTRLSIPDAEPTRKGYVFTGWNTKANGTGNHYNAGTEVHLDAQKNNQTFVLYAEWEAAS